MCCTTGWLIGLSVVCFLIGAPVMLGGYLPFRLWNQAAVPSTCVTTGSLVQTYCNNLGGPQYFCYEAYAYTIAEGNRCGTSAYVGTYQTKQAAWGWLDEFLGKQPCYYVLGDCLASPTLKDELGTLIAGSVFTALSAGLCAGAIVLCVLSKRAKRQEYEEV